MTTLSVPLAVVPVSGLTYRLIAHLLLRDANVESIKPRMKALSAGHAILATIAVLLALRASPLVAKQSDKRQVTRYRADGNLDDSDIQLIQEHSLLANTITSWETGYLLYDTWAMVHYSHPQTKDRGFAQSIATVASAEPAVFGHHVLLSSAFLYLQYYIHQGRERGIWIIAAFLLMNASSPVMHLRWWFRRKDSRTVKLDYAFAAIFALSRFGSVYWVLRNYGASHGLNVRQTLTAMRVPCQVGTAALTGLNAMWWMTLVNGIIRRSLDAS